MQIVDVMNMAGLGQAELGLAADRSGPQLSQHGLWPLAPGEIRTIHPCPTLGWPHLENRTHNRPRLDVGAEPSTSGRCSAPPRRLPD